MSPSIVSMQRTRRIAGVCDRHTKHGLSLSWALEDSKASQLKKQQGMLTWRQPVSNDREDCRCSIGISGCPSCQVLSNTATYCHNLPRPDWCQAISSPELYPALVLLPAPPKSEASRKTPTLTDHTISIGMAASIVKADTSCWTFESPPHQTG